MAGATFGRSRGTGIDGAGPWITGSAGIVELTVGGSDITGPLPPWVAGRVEAGGCVRKGCSEQPAAASKATATKVRDSGSIEIPRPRLSGPRADQIKEDCWSPVLRQ
ncbi:MAG: hypothetical protein KA760_15510, partial [Steroidobacteraceae bacterium]|nr:hypothetical protein [Steroidobacteraceae bacterium]